MICQHLIMNMLVIYVYTFYLEASGNDITIQMTRDA